jgi:hypothetical protein
VRFPFVSRGVYETTLELLRDERRRTNDLMDVLVKLKVSGASIPRDPAMMKPLEARAVDPIEEAITENKHARANPRIRMALSHFADTEKRKGTSTELILERLRSWDRVDRASDDDDENDSTDHDTIALVTERTGTDG